MNEESEPQRSDLTDLLCDGLLFGGDCDVPPDVAVCPECNSVLHAENQDFDIESGAPTKDGLYVYCNADPFGDMHKHWQGDWMPIIEAVEKWCGAVTT